MWQDESIMDNESQERFSSAIFESSPHDYLSSSDRDALAASATVGAG